MNLHGLFYILHQFLFSSLTLCYSAVAPSTVTAHCSLNVYCIIFTLCAGTSDINNTGIWSSKQCPTPQRVIINLQRSAPSLKFENNKHKQQTKKKKKNTRVYKAVYLTESICMHISMEVFPF